MAETREVEVDSTRPSSDSSSAATTTPLLMSRPRTRMRKRGQQQRHLSLEEPEQKQPKECLDAVVSNNNNNNNNVEVCALPSAPSPLSTSSPPSLSKASSKASNAHRLASALLASSAAAAAAAAMKVPPISLPTGSLSSLPFAAAAAAAADRGHASAADHLLWRYPSPFLPPASPLETSVRTQLPAGLGADPRMWSRDDVVVFLCYCQKEYDLERIDLERFQMNGKALCLLTKSDLAERCGGSGDVIHNILQLLVREASVPHCLSLLPPSSPLTPRPAGLITPTSPAFPPPPSSPWHPSLLNAEAFGHLISQTNTVTLSPSSMESNGVNGQTSAADSATAAMAAAAVAAHSHSLFAAAHHLSSSSRSKTTEPTHSDSEESASPASPTRLSAPPTNPSPKGSPQQTTPLMTSGTSDRPTSSSSPLKEATSTASENTATSSGPELNTHGRLLWDFLQQLLNEPQQKYSNYIAWKEKETGVFKIVDPAGLAKLWGIQKNHLSMNYDKMSRALRYYYKVDILRKVQGERHCYQFLRNPTELKNIKNISLLRQQMEAQAAVQKLSSSRPSSASTATELEPESESMDEPTDLTLDAEEKAAVRDRLAQQQQRELSNSGNSFDFRRLIPQVAIKNDDHF